VLRVVLVDELRKPQRAGHARGPAADDDHVGLHLRALDAFQRSTEDQQFKTFLAADERRKTQINKESELICVPLRSSAAEFTPLPSLS
jgi:hypothetical protein